MKVLFVSLNRFLLRERVYHPCFPLGMASVAAATRQAGHEVSCLDLAFQEDTASAIRSRVASFQPEVVGLSMRIQLNWLYCTVPSIARDVEIIKASTDAPIVIGGGVFTEFAEDVLRVFGLTYGVLGDGEEVFPQIVDRISCARSFDDLPGVAVRTPDGTRLNGFARVRDLTRLPPPARDLFDTLPRYPVLNFFAGRGMPKWTQFRSSYLIEGGEFRAREVLKVVEELDELVDSGFTDFYLVDEIANEPPEFYDKLVHEIIGSGLGDKINLDLVVQPRLVTPGRFDKLMRAGLKFFEMEVDSLSQTLLERIGSLCSVDVYRRITRMCEEAGCLYNYYMFVGGPSEDMNTAGETFERLDEWDPSVVLLLESMPLDPGSQLLHQAIEEGVLQAGEDMFTHPKFYNPPVIRACQDEYLRMVEDLFDRHPCWGWANQRAIMVDGYDEDEIARSDLHVRGMELEDRARAVLDGAVKALPAVTREFIARGILTAAWRVAEKRGASNPSAGDVTTAIREAVPRVCRDKVGVAGPPDNCEREKG